MSEWQQSVPAGMESFVEDPCDTVCSTGSSLTAELSEKQPGESTGAEDGYSVTGFSTQSASASGGVDQIRHKFSNPTFDRLTTAITLPSTISEHSATALMSSVPEDNVNFQGSASAAFLSQHTSMPVWVTQDKVEASRQVLHTLP